MSDLETRRTEQRRKVVIRSVHVDLPPDLSLAIRYAADRARVSPEALIIDVLRDIFEPVVASQGELAVSETRASTAPPA